RQILAISTQQTNPTRIPHTLIPTGVQALTVHYDAGLVAIVHEVRCDRTANDLGVAPGQVAVSRETEKDAGRVRIAAPWAQWAIVPHLVERAVRVEGAGRSFRQARMV